jgi:hypothetical protein
MVSRKGFTKGALTIAKDKSIGCFSLLPDDPGQVGFSIGDMWYGVIGRWTNVRLVIHFALPRVPMAQMDPNTVKWNAKPVKNWFIKQLLTMYANETREGDFTIWCKFEQPRDVEVEGREYPVCGIDCVATRVCRKKRKWVHWSGEAFFEWETSRVIIPPKGVLVSSAVETDLSTWPDYDGEVPEPGKQAAGTFVRVVMYDIQKWDTSKDNDVPDLASL